MDTGTELNFEKICRICLKSEYEMFSLFDNVYDDGPLYSKVHFCTNIKIDKDDNLPSKICKICLKNVNTAYDLKKLSEQSDIILRKRLKTLNYESDDNTFMDIIYCNIKDESEESNHSIEIKSIGMQDEAEPRKSPSPKKSVPTLKPKEAKTGTRSTISKISSSNKTIAIELDKDSKSDDNENDEKDEMDILSKVLLEGFNRYPCKLCEKAFDTKYSLNRHIQRHQDNRPFKCEICSRSFRERQTLKVHMRIHSGEKPFSCDFCPMTFTQNSSRKSHMRQHSQETPFQCDICGRLYKVSSTYKQHLASHKNERNFVCGVCGARFNFQSALRKHSVMHSNERTCVCKVCHKGFRRPENLKSHMRIHSEEMPFKCDICLKTFRYNCVLKAHLKSKHCIISGQPNPESAQFQTLHSE